MGMKVHMLVTGDEAGPAPASYALYGVDLGVQAELRPYGWEDALDFGGVSKPGLRSPTAMWFIEDGPLKIIVDTGADTSETRRLDARDVLGGHDFDLWTDHRHEWTAEAQLARFGLHPSDIDVVINTHFHFDHIGNNTRFTNARFIAQRSELSYLLHPPRWAQFYYPEFAFNVLEVRDRLELIDGPMKVTDGVSVMPLGGHSIGSQVVLVDTDAGRVCIAGDIVPFYKNLELNWPTGAVMDVNAVMRAHAWMSANADVILPQHDWKFFELYPGGCVE
jgi:glyoxylase-like metal-dependent hydrolase (beta-lactamase superfamily II)